MRRVFRLLTLILVLGAALFQAWQAYQTTAATWSPDQVDKNFVAEWEQRLNPVQADIPADVTYIGYVADWDIPDSPWDPIDQTTEYVLTQYTFTPRVVRRGFVSQWVIGNFTNPAYRAWLDAHLPAYSLEDYGFGIVLIRIAEAQP